ncbi:homoserine kinase [Sulfurospirillum sp. T05]|uniref:Homoserine kinase n=1 Tax=Sulfurospirillum tamanense TaxID=2813362 RepID=A0ABS2WP38_9BACT|nr:homoserine kinase [Sulfurospirillum tamanensis]MBN2963451.1 homoserine kinase [Sulfurospirillum tamanensis]
MKIYIPATSANLGPGFDALGLSLSLHNRVSITPSSLGSISIKGEGADRPRLKTHNPFVSIFHEVYTQMSGRKRSFRFEFENKIPLSRGLGSSSAVIVGAIASAYHMAGMRVEKENVLNRALEYESHPDNIAPAVHGGFTTSIVHEGKVYTQKKSLPESIKAVLVIPDRPMSTAKSRTQLPKHYSMKECVNNLSHAAFLSATFLNEQWDLLHLASLDMMHEERRMRQLPELFRVRKMALEAGALMSTLSGSGSTFLNIVRTEEAEGVKAVLKKAFPEYRVDTCAFDNEGFTIENS